MPLFGEKNAMTPSMEQYFQTIIQSKPAYANLPQQKKNDLVEKWMKQLGNELAGVLNKNMTDAQISTYNEKYRRSTAEANEYVRKVLPNLAEKQNEIMMQFAQKLTK